MNPVELAQAAADELDISSQAAEQVLLGLAGLSDRVEKTNGIAPPLPGTQRDADTPAVETKLRLAEARYRTLVEQMPVVTFLAALDGGVNELYVSPQIETMLGFSQKEWLENPVLWYEQLHPDDRRRWHLEFAQTCATGERFRSEYRFLSRAGRVVWVHGEAQMIRDETGAPIYLQGIAYDITEKKLAEEVLLRANEELELGVRQRTAELASANEALAQQAQELARSNAELEQFAYVASHDLQEPLRMVSSFTQLLAQRYRHKVDAEADEFVEYVVDGARRMQQLINDLLAYSRVGRKGREPVAVDCGAILDTVRVNLRRAIEEASAAIRCESLPWVLADEAHVLQIFQNLLGNAVKFRKKDQAPAIDVGARLENGAWLFWVRDNGIGIEPQYAEKIFLVFQRLHNRREYPGTGIGLAICKKAVEHQGGRIWLDSQPGVGSTFYFTLPIDTSAENGHE